MFQKEVYKNRRAELLEKISSGIVIFMGNQESAMNYPSNTYHFRQDSHFLYYVGLSLPNMAMIMDADAKTCTLYGDDFEIDDIIWMGPQPKMSELSEKSAIKFTAPSGDFDKIIIEAKNAGRKIHFLPPYRAENKIKLNALLDIPFGELNAKSSTELIKAIVAQREIKTDLEIAEMEKACETGYMMQTTAMKMAKAGRYERELAGTIEGIALAGGGGVSFPVILSQNGETLHNHDHSQKLENGRLLLVDCGAENEMNYCSDYTRTMPVGGKYNERQKAVYQIVLDANMGAIKAIKPNVHYRDIHFLSCRIIVEGLQALGLMKGNVNDAVEKGAHALFMPHGLGHQIGLDVHDMEDLGEDFVGYDEKTQRSQLFGTAYLRMGKELKTGHVITVEPGIYFVPTLIDIWKAENKFAEFINYEEVEKYKGFGGIRIEDDVLVTKTSYRVLGRPIPKTIEEVEAMMA
ncbi:MAG: aminopeptidase P family protein [Bacteroidales bacterium]|nr:aminopeptidase P family protein [Bacteroidales bacterium]